MDDLDVVNQVIQFCRQALEATSDSDPNIATPFLDLGSALHERYQITGQVDDLGEAIQYFQKSIETITDNHPELADRIQHLGNALHDRYLRTGQIDDLNHAILYYSYAVDASQAEGSPEHSDFEIHIRDLAVGLRHRYLRTDQVDDLDKAIRIFEDVVEALSDKHPYPGSRYEELGNALRDRYHLKRQMDDLERALQYFRKAIETTSDDHPDRVSRFESFGAGLHDQYLSTGQVADLDQAIDYYRRAIEDTQGDHPNQASLLQSLGSGLRDRYERASHIADLRDSTKAFKASFSHAPGLPVTRILAGKGAIQNLIREQKWDNSAQIAEEILQLLPEVTSLGGSRRDLQHTLRILSGFASQTASIFLKAGRSPLVALQALERGRGIIASLMMDARSDVSALKYQYPQLWSRYTNCREQITLINMKESLNSNENSQEPPHARTNRRQQLSKTLKDLQNEIRGCPGYERFLLPPTEKELRGMAQDGFLVCFNVSSVSSEAFMVTSTGIQVLRLPDLEVRDIQRGVRVFASRGNSARRDASFCDSDEEESPTSNVSMELRLLWKHAVRPVLNRLGLLDQKDTPHRLSRIWWVGGGSLALMPLHAAGEHALESMENTFSHVVSSYAPTFKALQFVQNKLPFTTSNTNSKQKILIVSMPTTPEGYKAIELTGEIAAIQKYSKPWASVTSLCRPDRDSVVDALRYCNIAHFACHATADQMEPAKSALLLGKDVLEKLTLEDMDTINHDQAQIAYLSACSTAEIKVENLADESIHLASAFQLAGFMHVIGTLWAAHDNASVEIASKFYENLNLNEEGAASVAQALHHAVLCYRNKDDNRTAVAEWAPFIHLGC